MFLFICNKNTNLHSKPVSLCTLESVGKLKAVHLQQVKEGISHHIRYAVFRLLQTTVKPVNMYHFSSFIKKGFLKKKKYSKPVDKDWKLFSESYKSLLVVTVTVRHGKDVTVEDTKL